MRVDRLSEQIGAIQALKHAFDPILNVIIVALDAPPVFVRTKAQNLSSVWLHRCLDEGTRAYKWPSVKSSNTLEELLSSSPGVS